MIKSKEEPIVIFAIQFTGDCEQVFDWVGQWHPEDDGPGMWESDDKNALIIDTAEDDTMRVEKGDWIIRNVKGEFHSYKPDVYIRLNLL